MPRWVCLRVLYTDCIAKTPHELAAFYSMRLGADPRLGSWNALPRKYMHTHVQISPVAEAASREHPRQRRGRHSRLSLPNTATTPTVVQHPYRRTTDARTWRQRAVHRFRFSVSPDNFCTCNGSPDRPSCSRNSSALASDALAKFPSSKTRCGWLLLPRISV